ncbi:hypothetical protein DES34_108287 [Brevibacillus brevis]|nr:hypothetical protein DES34_108287 [Brevibacillus brevis]GEC90674.1 hypothetical protein BBR01nite_30050 [Brevibacillus brevis]
MRNDIRKNESSHVSSNCSNFYFVSCQVTNDSKPLNLIMEDDNMNKKIVPKWFYKSVKVTFIVSVSLLATFVAGLVVIAYLQ